MCAVLTELRQKCLISSDSHDILQCMTDDSLIKQIETGMVNGKYSVQLRSFALTLNFYSPKAYNYVRKVFKNIINYMLLV